MIHKDLEVGCGDAQQRPTAKSNTDVEKQGTTNETHEKKSVYAGLGWLDRLLVLWILLAIIVGILLGNFVDDVGPALQKGKFVDVSVPIGESLRGPNCFSRLTRLSGGIIGHDVPDIV
jgi:hypothetical protein